MSPKPRVGVSRCLLGDEVRYDGTHKRDSAVLNLFGGDVEWVPVCPEVEIGMGTPREPIRISSRSSRPERGAEVEGALPNLWRWQMAMSRRSVRSVIRLAVLLAFVLLPTTLFAQQSPWERAALNLEATFTGPLARLLAQTRNTGHSFR